jgi:hypothetical protein
MKIQHGLLFTTDGRKHEVRPANGKRFELPELQMALGGYAQCLVPSPSIQHCRQMYCNEDGWQLKLPPNHSTTDVVNSAVYEASGYEAGWQVAGNIFAIVTIEKSDTIYPTIKQTLRKLEAANVK